MLRVKYRCDKCGGTKHYIPSKASVIVCQEKECGHEHKIQITDEVKYVDMHGDPLVTQCIIDHLTDGEPKPHLTVPHSSKWYRAYVITVNEEVKPVAFIDIINSCFKATPILTTERTIYGSEVIDHAINPAAFHVYAIENNLSYDDKTFALICERWVEDVLDSDWTKLHLYLPKS